MFGGKLNSSGAASGALVKGYLSVFGDTRGVGISKERLAWAKGLHLPCVCGDIIQYC